MGNVFKIKHFILLIFSKVTMLSWVLNRDPGSANKVGVPVGRDCKQSCEGPPIKKLLTYVKSNQGLYTDRWWSFNLNLVSVRDKSFGNSAPKSHGPRPVLLMSWLSSLPGVWDKGRREQSGWILWSSNHPPDTHLKGRQALGLVKSPQPKRSRATGKRWGMADSSETRSKEMQMWPVTESMLLLS